MGWKTIGGREYFYESIREGDRVRSEYMPGELGILACRLNQITRAKRIEERRSRELAESTERKIREWCEAVRGVVAEILAAAGYHRHKRGIWRKRRMGEPMKVDVCLPEASDREVTSIASVFKRAQNGDKSALPELRKILLKPGMAKMIEDAGSMSHRLKTELLDQYTSTNLLFREAADAKLAKVQADFEGPDPTPAERLLAERAAMCWWLVNRYELDFASQTKSTIRQADYQQKLIDRVHGRFLSAVKTLATVRKLATPTVQLNIGANQVNTVIAG